MSDSNQDRSVAARRRFLLSASAAVAAAVPTAKAADMCVVTDGDILGPFYLPGAKNTVKMADAGTKGQHITLTGTVLAPDCKTPIAGATVDFWHCDHDGAYDIKAPGEKLAPENYRFRAVTQTDKEGRFVFETIVPGRYAIPPGLPGLEKEAGQTRPAHYHITVIHPIFVPLTTQLYIKGDPYIAKDPWAQHSHNAFELRKSGNTTTGNVEIVLASRPGQPRG